jgi:hypothetical protein
MILVEELRLGLTNGEKETIIVLYLIFFPFWSICAWIFKLKYDIYMQIWMKNHPFEES